MSSAISCETPGAAIYFTTDGSLPWSGNLAATLYTAPVEITEAGEFFAAAYLAGRSGSAPAFKIIA